jgi:hypothetical protein
MLFSSLAKKECIWCFNLKNLHACDGYHVPPSVETGCIPLTLMRPEINLSATNMFLSLDILAKKSARICLFSGSIDGYYYPQPDEFKSNFT